MIYFRGLLKNSAYSRCWGYPFSETLSPWNSIETFTIPWTFPLFFFFLSLLDIQSKLLPSPGLSHCFFFLSLPDIQSKLFPSPGLFHCFFFFIIIIISLIFNQNFHHRLDFLLLLPGIPSKFLPPLKLNFVLNINRDGDVRTISGKAQNESNGTRGSTKRELYRIS